MSNANDDAQIARAAAVILLSNGARLKELVGSDAADYLLRAAAETATKTPNTAAPQWQVRRTVIDGEHTT
jgi:hypothetical protein